jgi:hypothetical protein
MAANHISSISSAMFTNLCITTATKSASQLPTGDSAATPFATYTSASPEFTEIRNIKEFPAIGTPANIVKVPEYGSETSFQIQGQADAPQMEITLNYVPSEWAENKLLGGGGIKVGDKKTYMFRFALLAKAPGLVGGVVDLTDGFGDTANSCYYFLGKLEALEVTPSLTDAMTAKLTISVQSSIVGAYSVA